MEDLRGEWQSAVAGIEPVRLEFPYADATRVRKGAIISAVLYLAYFALPLAMSWSHPEALGGMLWFFAVVVAVCESVVWSWHHLWSSREPEIVTLQGLTMRVMRTGIRGAQAQSEFDLLEVHDLRTAPNEGLRYALVWPLPKAHRPPVYDTSEPIRFTYHGRGYSIGGASAKDEVLRPFVERIAAYDAEVRRRLGMSPTPSITTYDHERVVAAMGDAWDVNVIAGALE